ncbi:hypothetical protein [Streptomyces sp. NPDC127084]|uniref:hypothetical protein n=1 Tax=Streptomyces sp. NPDC127084 TaxID=3347133 RepID=UPI0036528ED6
MAVRQVHVRERARQRAATQTGMTVELRATFGYKAPTGTTDDPRFRILSPLHLSADWASGRWSR